MNQGKHSTAESLDETITPESRLARQNRILARVTIAVGVMLLALNAVLWLIPPIADPMIAGLTDGHPVTITPFVRLGIFCIATLHSSILFIGLLAVAGLFRSFARGEAFAPRTGVLLRRFGIALVAYTLLGSVANTLMIAVATLANAPGENLVKINAGFSTQGLVILLTAGLLVALGHVMQDAARMAEDHRQIV